ncbi:hypothetical protein ACKFKG_09785 [Phormidesmis sp. 146-35]
MQLLRLDRWLGLAFLLVGLGLGGARSVSARVVQTDLTLEAEMSPSFAALMQQAEQLAEKSVSQAFKQADVTEVLMRLSGDRSGESVPLLTVKVTRSDWQKDSRLRSHARYYSIAARLLKFEGQVAQTAPPFSSISQNSADDPAFRDD